jgi:uncharacterized protein YwgA
MFVEFLFIIVNAALFVKKKMLHEKNLYHPSLSSGPYSDSLTLPASAAYGIISSKEKNLLQYLH